MVGNYFACAIVTNYVINLDQSKLSLISQAAIKCAASARIAAYRPTLQSALQQLIACLREIRVCNLLNYVHGEWLGELCQLCTSPRKLSYISLPLSSKYFSSNL